MANFGRRKGADRFAVAMASGLSIREAADTANISERSAYRLLQDPAFQQRVSKLRADLIDQAAGRLADAVTDAAETLRKLLNSGNDAIRLGAAKAIIEAAFKSRELIDWERRLSGLEGRLDATCNETETD